MSLYMCLSDDDIEELVREINGQPISDGGRSPLDRILIGLHDDRRRCLLYHLDEEDPCSLDGAARRVAAWEHGCDPDDVPDDIYDRVKLDLYHTHLPKLADLNVLDYDKRSEAIRLRDPPEKLSDFLELAREEDDLS